MCIYIYIYIHLSLSLYIYIAIQYIHIYIYIYIYSSDNRKSPVCGPSSESRSLTAREQHAIHAERDEWGQA